MSDAAAEQTELLNALRAHVEQCNRLARQVAEDHSVEIEYDAYCVAHVASSDGVGIRVLSVKATKRL